MELRVFDVKQIPHRVFASSIVGCEFDARFWQPAAVDSQNEVDLLTLVGKRMDADMCAERSAFYKYLDPKGAKLTLQNGTFRHARPSDFSDDMDMSIEKLFPVPVELASERILEGIVGVIVENIGRVPTVQNAEFRTIVLAVQNAIKLEPGLEDVLQASLKSELDEDFLKNLQVIESSLDEINQFLDSHRVFCVTDNNSSMRMWEEYSANHTGIVLKISPSLAKDSKFSRFQKVRYSKSPATLFEDAGLFVRDTLFGGVDDRNRKTLDRIIYTKTLSYEFEQEYRLVIPAPLGETVDTMPYHPEEITELYLGAKMDESMRTDVIELAVKRNPAIHMFQSEFNSEGKLSFFEL